MRADAGRPRGWVKEGEGKGKGKGKGKWKGKGRGEGFKGRGCVCQGDRVWEIGSVNRGRRGFFLGLLLICTKSWWLGLSFF